MSKLTRLFLSLVTALAIAIFIHTSAIALDGHPIRLFKRLPLLSQLDDRQKYSITLIADKQINFDSQKSVSEHRWQLKELNEKLPSDWSSFRFLVVEMKARSPQMFEMRLVTKSGVNSLKIHPFQNTWIRAAIPLEIFHSPPKKGNSVSSLVNNQRLGYFMSNFGPYFPIDRVEAIAIAMPYPLHAPTLEIKSIRLTTESPGDAILENQPLVDEFGQWMNVEWPGKIYKIEQLKTAWIEEEKTLKSGNFNYCRYGGYCATKAKATGFFRVELIEGKWWFVDPEGHLFFSTGVNVINPRGGTSVVERKYIFKQLPPENLLPANPERASFYLWNLWRRFGEQWQPAWLDLTVRRMQAWGFNTVGNWSAKEITDARRMPYVITLKDWHIETNYLGLPDIYSNEFVRHSDRLAKEQCEPRKNDRFLIGYFAANEPSWSGRESTVIDLILTGPETATKRELQKYLVLGDTPQRRKIFVHRAYEKYLKMIEKAIRKYDPNHLILGIRFAGNASDETIRAAGIFDVFSVNIYNYVPDRKDLERFYRLSKRPILLGEFHFGVPGRGMSAGLKQVRDRKERGIAYRYYVENAAAMPAVIGTHWFQWVDQPSTGRSSDGENYNIGFVDVTDRPDWETIETVKLTHARLYDIHSGKLAPSDRKPLVN
ncbi:MAG TPA: hypothetical protein V6D28_14535 [Leptolyngbyaceae cyanobacterium]